MLNIPGCIDVTVVFCATMSAGPFLDGERQAFRLCPTARTGFAAGNPAIHNHYDSAQKRRFVSQLAAEFVEADVVDGT